MLQSFKSASEFEDLEQMLRRKDFSNRKEFIRLVHTIKGMAGTVGANQFFADAEKIEGLLHRFEDFDENALVEQLLNSYHLIANQIEKEIKPLMNVGNNSSTRLDRNDLLSQSHQLLSNADSEFQSLLEKHQTQFQELLGDDYPEFAQAVEDWDFDKALSILNRHEDSTLKKA